MSEASEGIKRAYLRLPAEMVRVEGSPYAIVRTDAQTGEETVATFDAKYTSLELPADLTVDGTYLGRGTISARFPRPEEDGTITLPFRLDRPVTVRMARRDEQGRYVSGEYEQASCDAKSLADALEDYAWVVLPRAFVHRVPYVDRETGEQRRFISATLPEGTVVDGRDLSGAEFRPRFAQRGYRTAEVTVVALRKGRPVTLTPATRGEDGRVTHDRANDLTVAPEALATGVREQHARFVAERRARDRMAASSEPAPERAQGQAGPDLYDHDVEFGPQARSGI